MCVCIVFLAPLSPQLTPLSLPPPPRMFLTMATVWVLLSLAGSILRLLSLRLLGDKTYLSFITSSNLSNVTK